MNQYTNISKQVFINYISTFLVFLLGPLQIFILTRFLSVEEYGVFSILSITLLFLVPLLDFGFSYFLLTKFSSSKFNDKIVNSLIIFELFALLIVVSLFLFFKNLFLDFMKGSTSVNELYLFLVLLLFSLFLSFLFSYIRAQRKLEFSAILFFLKEGLWTIILFLYILLYNKLSLDNVLIIWIIGTFITLFLEIIYSQQILFRKWSFHFEDINYALSFGFPLIPFVIGGIIVSLGDRYVINYYLGNESVAFYSVAYSLVSVALSLGTVVQTNLYPHISNKFNSGENENTLFDLSIKYSLLFVIPSIVGIFVLREQLVTLLAGVSYISSAAIIPWLVLFPIIAIIIQILLQKLMLLNKTGKVGFIFLSGGILNIFLNIILIPYFVLIGSAIATVTSYIYMFILTIYFCGRITLNYSLIKPFRIIISSLIMGVIIWFINPQILLTKILTILVGVVVYGICLLSLKTFSKDELNILKSFIIPK